MSQNNRGRQTKNTSSGHGALGMGGQPSDETRDENSGGKSVDKEDRTVKVSGAFGGREEKKGGGTPEL
ncbi:MAG: hypothetical protein JWN86_3583 [Planctomycetota bacterium]|nr:hypothetical protein [Planctomycetota bacterium]